MKKVLEGELISLAHSILQAKSDDVHQLKDKAGLLYEKLCILSFAEKHFAGKQPSIGKIEFKSAFEIDLDEIITPKNQSKLTATKQKKSNPIVESEPVSVETESTKENVIIEEETPQIEIETPEKETISTTDKTEKEEVVDVNKKAEMKENAISEEKTSTQNTSSNEGKNSTTKENEQQLFQPLAEEDFGVHLDDLPDFEPISSTTQNSKKEAPSFENKVEKETTSIDKEAEIDAIPEVSKPQRTMDLFSQEKKSLNEQLKNDLKIGLNDRLAFTSKLFEGNANAYNQTMAKVTHFNSYNEVEMYLYNEVRPKFSWDKHEAVEQRFLEIIEAKFN